MQLITKTVFARIDLIFFIIFALAYIEPDFFGYERYITVSHPFGNFGTLFLVHGIFEAVCKIDCSAVLALYGE